MKEINFIVRDIIKPILKNYSPVIIIIRRNWGSIVGEKYYDFCEADKVFFQKNKKNDGNLYVKCFNNVISFYIENNKLFIIEKINALFGYHLIGDIKIKQEPKIIKQYNKKSLTVKDEDKITIKNLLKDIENPELKSTLQSLGDSIFGEKNN